MHAIIKELQSSNSRLFKEQVILREATAGNDEFFQGLKLAFSPFVTFGIKQVPVHSEHTASGTTFKQFVALADQLAQRELTGHAARDAIYAFMMASTEEQWNNWFRLILIKDMRAGFSETIVNKMVEAAARPDYATQLFETMLAFDGAKHPKKIKGRKLLEVKGDGCRLITIINVDDQTVFQYSRNGKRLDNFGHLTSAIMEHISEFTENTVLDSEIMSSSFQELMKQVQRKSNVQSSDARMLVFDTMPLSEFKFGRSVLGQSARSAQLLSMKPLLDKIGGIDVIEQEFVDLDTIEGRTTFAQYNRIAIANKFEGIMIKDPDAVYECKRSTAWLKMKPVISVDLTIVGVEEGTGKNAGRMGALVCQGSDDGKFIRVNVGSGFTDTQRIELWTRRDTLIGMIVEIKADCLTQNQDDSDTYSLRFPRFERFRGFEANEKL